MADQTHSLNVTADAVVVVVVRDVGGRYETLLVRRAKEPLAGRWLYVSGRMEAGETAPETAIRELREETGLTADRLYSANAVEAFYAVTLDTVCLFPVFVAFVSVDAEVRLNHEANDFQWLGFDDAMAMVPAANPRVVLRRIQQDFLAYERDPWFELDPRTGRPVHST